MNKIVNYKDNPYCAPPKEYLGNTAAANSNVVRFSYKTKNYTENDNKFYNKYALVYLPEGYDENDSQKQYNILYLIHGGACTPEWYLGGEGKTTEVTRLLDCMIRDGIIEPLIVCAMSWLNEYCEDAAINCLNYRYELINDLMPALENTFHIRTDRLHRAFSGYSMGAVVTWSVLEHCLDKFAYFIPMSGDCWSIGKMAGGCRPYDTAAELAGKIKASGYTAADFVVYAGCGDADIAEPNLTPQINSMKKFTDTFVYKSSFSDGNLYECICPDCGHDLKTAIHILFNGLPKLFRKGNF